VRYPELHYQWLWRLRSSPEKLWPLVSNTDRFNRDTGLPAVSLAEGQAQSNGRRRLGFTRYGVELEWEEEPFEWVRPYRFGVNRRYRTGPLQSLRVRAELIPQQDGGTRLVYDSWVLPRNLLGLVGTPPAMSFVNRRAFGAAFRTYDQMVQRGVWAAAAQAVELAPGGQARLEALQHELGQRIADPKLAARIVNVVATGDDLTLARLRAYAVADAIGEPRRTVLEACLQATRLGLFDLQWDVLCPLCRGPKQTVTTLEGLTREVHCDTCNIDFGANFERSVELTFRPTASVRAVESRKFCVGGPQVTPHVVAQQLLAPGDRRTLSLPLEPGRHRVRTMALPGGAYLMAMQDGAIEAAFTINPDGWPDEERRVSLSPTLQLDNATSTEQLLIIERMAWTDQAATAAEVTSLQAFRDLFSREILRPGESISVGSLAILFTDLRDSTVLYRQVGDAPAFGRVLDHFTVLRKTIAAEDGAVIKTIGDAVMAVFLRPVAAVRAMLAAQERLAEWGDQGGPRLYLKAGVHYGPCIAVTMNDHLDYFGSTVNLASRLEKFSSGEDVIVSDVIRRDPEVAALVASGGELTAERFEAQLKGFDEQEFPLWKVARSPIGSVASESLHPVEPALGTAPIDERT
jgi:class 3 adenylate cyclase